MTTTALLFGRIFLTALVAAVVASVIGLTQYSNEYRAIKSTVLAYVAAYTFLAAIVIGAAALLGHILAFVWHW